MFDKLNKPDIELDAFKCQGKHYKIVYWSTCKRDLVVRDRDVWFSVRDETETFLQFLETETLRNNYFVFIDQVHQYNVWTKKDLYINNCSTTFGKRELSFELPVCGTTYHYHWEMYLLWYLVLNKPRRTHCKDCIVLGLCTIYYIYCILFICLHLLWNIVIYIGTIQVTSIVGLISVFLATCCYVFKYCVHVFTYID